jgi:hypothetical protein
MKGKIADKQQLLHILDTIAEIQSYTGNKSITINNWRGSKLYYRRNQAIIYRY